MKWLNVKIGLILIVCQSALFAASFTWFTPEHFGKPFVSDIRSSILKFEEGFINDLGEFYYYPDYDKRLVSEGHVGGDVPVISYVKRSGDISFKSTFLMTGAFNLIIDSLEPTARTVLNTDYWLGSEFRSVLYHPGLDKFRLRNIGLNLIPMYHESTHLGDEFVMDALARGTDFYRVNVSYESWVLALTLNDLDTLKGNVFSTRIGIQGIWFPADGYYQYNLEETQGQDLLPSHDHLKYWIQFNWRRTRGLGASDVFHQVNSLEIRRRIKYGYEADDPEKVVWNFNGYFGWVYNSDSYRKVGGFLRLYYGINPHGQFRNIDNFYFVGLSLVVM